VTGTASRGCPPRQRRRRKESSPKTARSFTAANSRLSDRPNLDRSRRKPREGCTVARMARWNPADEALTVAAHQAAGIVAEQAHCDIREAFRQLITRSTGMGQSLDNTAHDVIDHVIRFDE
jgi:hypothetical protein